MRRLAHLAFALSIVCATRASAQLNAGVSDERVSLPQAPGSISGVGQNASLEGNQGALTYAVDIEVPQGFEGLTPELSFSYSSTGGASVVGMGWSLPSFSLERMTAKGLQKYDLNDRFVADGANELVRVAQAGATATYRARFEGGFVRYTWLARGTGEGGSWKAEYPDGRVGYYGATKAGAAVATAQVIVPTTSKVFAWKLVTLEDPWGHQMNLTWTKDSSGTPLLERIDYLYEGATARHSVRFTYETRPDPQSDAKPGFELKLTRRLKDVRIFSGTTAPEQIRSYVVEYEPATTSGGQSRVAAISRLGRGDAAYPVRFTFGYSKTLGTSCTTNCERPFGFDMGTVPGVDFSTGRATLVDINGDALPDVLFSDAQGQHRFFYARLDAEGRARFSTTPVISTRTMGGSPFVLGDPRAQLLDVNGDGFVDITQAKLPALLCNNGSGDWVDPSVCAGSPQGLPAGFTPEDDSGDAVQQDPKFVRFFDYDNDKRIDWLRTFSSNGGTEVLANADGGFTSVSVDNIGATFDEGPLQLADVNGDGLQDPVLLTASGAVVTLAYKLNLGFGQWSPDWRSVVLSGFSASQAASLDLEDINGDGLVDVLSVTGNEVAIALNKTTDTFAPVMTLTSTDLGSGAIPTRTPTTTVSYADMNGNGSADIVWFQPTGQVTYLELFPVRPNLISRIDNGIGAIQRITYGSSIGEQARDNAASMPWPNRVPNATVLVTSLDSFVTLTGSEDGGLHEIVTQRYHAGYYDGAEKQFRGYERVDTQLLADRTRDGQEPTLIVTDYDVGKTDPAFAGRQRIRSVFSLAGTMPSLVSQTRTLLALCPVAEVPTGLTPPVAFVCNRADTAILVERDAMNARTLEVEHEYDGYGNVVRDRNLGVKHLGTPEMARGCQACVASGLFGRPCDMSCTGDELFTETTYVTPGTDTGGAWLLNKVVKVQSGAVAGMLNVETQNFYDGPDFVGLMAGRLTKGGLTRVINRKGPGTDFVETFRAKLDTHGNVVESLTPNATLTGAGERRLYTVEPAGLWATKVEVKLGATTSLVQEVTYDYAWELINQSSNWYPQVNGMPAASPQQTRYRYDEHGRLVREVDPGDSDAAPTVEYQYELRAPASKILTLRRSGSGAADLVTADCLDGQGRVVQRRSRLSATSWQVNGFTEFDAQGAKVRVFQPYLGTSGDCEAAPPTGVPFTRYTYDVLRRALTEVEPDGAIRKWEHGPLVTKIFDEEDTDTTSPFANTPIVEEGDGLGRVISIERTNVAGQPSGVTTIEYDREGRLATVKDPAGRAHLQQYDFLGRVTQVTDVNSGVTRLEYDASGNRTRKVDARGKATRWTYDALNRPTAEWDEAAEATTKVTLTYDVLSGCTDCTQAGGKLVQAEYSALGSPGRDRYGYDPRGNLLYFERSLDGRAVTVRHQYDKADRLVSSTYPGGLTLTQTFDGASRLLTIPSYLTRLDYGARDVVTGATYANGVRTTFEYDDRRRLTKLKATTPDMKAIFDLALSRDKKGDLTQITDAADRPGRARHAAKLDTDVWGRLTRAELERAEPEAEVLTFAYDAVDNILRQTSSLGAASRANVGDYTYEPARPNAVSRAGGLDYTYDAAGHLKTRGPTSFEFDHLGRLAKASEGDVERARFGFGNGPDRVLEREGDSTTWHVTDGFEVRDGLAVLYPKLGKQPIARVMSGALATRLLSDLAPATGSGAVTPQGDGVIDVADAWLAQAAVAGKITFSGGPTPSPVGALLASAARRLLMESVTFLHQDHLQSVVAATDAQGQLVAEQSFFPTGELRGGRGFVDRRGFTGQRRDESTGLIHFQHRELDPLVGRWASVDPEFLELDVEELREHGEATTAYAYVANDFANVIDPTGLRGHRGGQGKGGQGKAPQVSGGQAKGGQGKGKGAQGKGGQKGGQGKGGGQAKKDAPKQPDAPSKVMKDVTVTPKGKPDIKGDVDIGPTLARIDKGGKDAHKNDGSTFQNKEGLLPAQPQGYYKEYVHRTEGVKGPGPQRVVVGQGGEKYYTPDHYKTFIPVK